MSGFWLLPLLWMGMVGSVLLYYRRDLLALWREPVLRYPVMIIESDDWGAGPVEAQAKALNQIADLLIRYKDHTGRHPVMTLALVLAVPDGRAIRKDGQYHRLTLEDPMFEPVLQAIEWGRAAGVFAPQLHGLEHYWPDALMASVEPAVRTWREGDAPATTEALPSHLQSRWVDATALPSLPLSSDAVDGAVSEEVRMYQRVFSEWPRVVVPPTFVWNETVEAAWAREGLKCVVTPGLRSACRNADGLPDCDTGPLHNGQQGNGMTYIVRDDYFEPERGHSAERALAALTEKMAQGRPCLLETHRSNFISNEEECVGALCALEELNSRALARNPTLRFLATAELAVAMRTRDPVWFDDRIGRRFGACCARARRLPGFRRWAKLTGMDWILSLPLVRRNTLKTRAV
jgi:hypothetical protein